MNLIHMDLNFSFLRIELLILDSESTISICIEYVVINMNIYSCVQKFY